MEKKHPRLAWLVLALAGALGLGAFLWTHVWIDGAFFPRSAQVYDLTDHELTAGEYEALRQRFPDAEIKWLVPFQGGRCSPDTAAITVTALTEADVAMLDYFPDLKQVDGTGCRDLEALLALARRRPEVEVAYLVPLGGQDLDSTARTITAADVTAGELEEALPHLTRLQSLTLEGTLPEADDLNVLRAAYPQVEFRFRLALGGVDAAWDATELDLTGADVALSELEAALPLLTDLETLVLTDTALTDDQCKDLARQFPDIFVLCQLDFAGIPFSTDAAEIDLSGQSVTVQEVEALLPFFPRLEKLILSGCGLDNETLDDLNRRHEELSIVWTVQVGRMTISTDATIFYPAGTYGSWMPNDQELENLRYCTELVAVDLGHAKITRCDFLADMSHLKYLILADSRISDITPLSGLKELVYLELFGTDVRDYAPLLGCTALQDLNIGSTHGDPEPLSRMTWLHTLLWHRATEDPETCEAVLRLPEQLPDTCVVLETWRNVGDIWRYLPNYYTFRDLIGGGYYNQAYTLKHWDQDAEAILDSARDDAVFAGDLLAQIVRRRIDSGQSIPGIKNIGSEKAEALYRTLLNARP